MKKYSILMILPLILIIIVSADMSTIHNHSSSRELGTKEIAHIAFVVKDIEATTKAYAEMFGLQVPVVRLGYSPEYMGNPTEGKAKMAFINLENITLEFFEPVGGPSAWQDFLDHNGEGVHHFGFWVEGLDDHIANLKSLNMPVIQSGGGDWGRYRYIDATSDLKIFIELMERSKPD